MTRPARFPPPQWWRRRRPALSSRRWRPRRLLRRHDGRTVPPLELFRSSNQMKRKGGPRAAFFVAAIGQFYAVAPAPICEQQIGQMELYKIVREQNPNKNQEQADEAGAVFQPVQGSVSIRAIAPVRHRIDGFRHIDADIDRRGNDRGCDPAVDVDHSARLPLCRDSRVRPRRPPGWSTGSPAASTNARPGTRQGICARTGRGDRQASSEVEPSEACSTKR